MPLIFCNGGTVVAESPAVKNRLDFAGLTTAILADSPRPASNSLSRRSTRTA